MKENSLNVKNGINIAHFWHNEYVRKNVKVKALMKETGEISPLSIVWEDGREYEIDRILSVRPAPSKSGGFALRFQVRIRGQIRFLYLDEYVWFLDENMC